MSLFIYFFSNLRPIHHISCFSFIFWSPPSNFDSFSRVWAGHHIRKKCQDRKLQIMYFKAAVLVLKYYFKIDRVVNCFTYKTKLKTTSDCSLSEIHLWKLVFSIWCMRKMIDWLYLFIWQPRLESLDVWWSTNKVSVAGEKFSNEIPSVSRSGYGIKDTVYLHTASVLYTSSSSCCLSGPGGWRQVAQHYQHPPDHQPCLLTEVKKQ